MKNREGLALSFRTFFLMHSLTVTTRADTHRPM